MAGGRLGSRVEESVHIELACMHHVFNQDLVTMCRLAVGMSSLVGQEPEKSAFFRTCP